MEPRPNQLLVLSSRTWNFALRCGFEQCSALWYLVLRLSLTTTSFQGRRHKRFKGSTDAPYYYTGFLTPKVLGTSK